jgi:hypothetical protein
MVKLAALWQDPSVLAHEAAPTLHRGIIFIQQEKDA